MVKHDLGFLGNMYICITYNTYVDEDRNIAYKICLHLYERKFNECSHQKSYCTLSFRHPAMYICLLMLLLVLLHIELVLPKGVFSGYPELLMWLKHHVSRQTEDSNPPFCHLCIHVA
jgi:hypothetical protein